MLSSLKRFRSHSAPWITLGIGCAVVAAFGLGLSQCAAQTGGSAQTAASGAARPATLLSPDPEGLPVEPVTLTPVVQGLEHPWGMDWLPNGDLLITERPGRLRIVRAGTLDPVPVAGVAPVAADVVAEQLFASSQGGLLDVAVHPGFADNGWVYFSYAHGDQQANGTRVARARFDGRTLRGWQVIFEVNRTKAGGQHFGSRLVWLPDDTLLVSIGDGGNPPVSLDGAWIRLQAQNPASHLGKVIRLREDGSIPPDNPFVGRKGANAAVWSLGHRNIQGMTYDAVRRSVWATEHGSRGGDELNLLSPGINYGWPIVSHSREYDSGRSVAPTSSSPGFADPRRVWMATIAPSGLAVMQGDRVPQWRGNLFAGGLVARSVRRLQLNESGDVIAESIIPIGERVRDVRQGPDGDLYVLTDAPQGRLLRLRPAGT
ncbi:PQQ-dependent sugar dehydrogenase [Synechococcus sp. CCY9201]|nr:PQQ-dependent sugar dehydrogenase [Synechococcus sp. CCY9201]